MRQTWMLVVAIVSAAVPVFAQPPIQGVVLHGSNEGMRSLQMAERNQLGLLRYCQERGLVGAAVVATQERLIALLPSDPGLGGTEEAAGRSGMIAFATPQASFVDDAKAKGVSVRYSCEQAALRVAEQADRLPR